MGNTNNNTAKKRDNTNVHLSSKNHGQDKKIHKHANNRQDTKTVVPADTGTYHRKTDSKKAEKQQKDSSRMYSNPEWRAKFFRNEAKVHKNRNLVINSLSLEDELQVEADFTKMSLK